MIGIGVPKEGVNLADLTKVVVAWVGTPVGTVIATIILYPFLGRLLRCPRARAPIYCSR